MNIAKEEFEVYDKHLNNDGGAYKKLKGNRWYNDEMYKEALNKALSLSNVSNCLHEDNFPINRFGDSQCTDCGKVISHLDM